MEDKILIAVAGLIIGAVAGFKVTIWGVLFFGLQDKFIDREKLKKWIDQ